MTEGRHLQIDGNLTIARTANGSDEATVAMKPSFDGDWYATVTDDPLCITPRFTGDSLDVATYVDVKGRARFHSDTFGSQDWLWDAPDVLRFDPDSRELAGTEFRLPYVSANAETVPHVPVMPEVRPGGLRADEVRDFRHEMCTVLCRAPGAGRLMTRTATGDETPPRRRLECDGDGQRPVRLPVPRLPGPVHARRGVRGR